MMQAIRTVFLIMLLVPGVSGILRAENAPVPETSASADLTSDSGNGALENKVAEDEIAPQAQTQVQSAVQTQPVTEPPPSDGPAASGFEFPILRTIGGFGLVLCLMIFLFFAGKRFFPQYFRKSDSEKRLKVIETLSMGEKRSIALIQVGDSVFLVGNTPDQINLLTPLPETSFPKVEPGRVSEPATGPVEDLNGNSFRNMYEVEKKRAVADYGSPIPEDVRTKMRLLREALEK